MTEAAAARRPKKNDGRKLHHQFFPRKNSIGNSWEEAAAEEEAREGCKIPSSRQWPFRQQRQQQSVTTKGEEKKKWILGTISWLKKAFFLIFSPFLPRFSNASLTATEDDEGDQGEISKRISWQETI